MTSGSSITTRAKVEGMSRFMDDARERRVHEHVARELEIAKAILDDYPYELDEANHGIVWRLLWEEAAPPGVQTNGARGSLWTDIRPQYEREL